MQKSRKRSSTAIQRSSSEYSSGSSSPPRSDVTQSESSNHHPHHDSTQEDHHTPAQHDSHAPMQLADSPNSSYHHNLESNRYIGWGNDAAYGYMPSEGYDRNSSEDEEEIGRARFVNHDNDDSSSDLHDYDMENDNVNRNRFARHDNDAHNGNGDGDGDGGDGDGDGDEEEDGAPTQSESEGVVDQYPSDGGATEDDWEQSPSRTSPRAPHNRSYSIHRPKRSFTWANYHPIVRTASEQCWDHGADPSAIAFARIVGTGKGAVDYYVRSRSVTIGRGYGTDCQIKSETRSISRKHAKIYWDAKLDHWMLTCLSAKNGMVVDGAPIVPFGLPVPVKSRTLIEIGDVAFFFLSAIGNTFCVNDLKLLEQHIIEARTDEANNVYHDDPNGVNDTDDIDEVQPARNAKSKSERSLPKKGKFSDGKKSKQASRKGAKTSLSLEKVEASSSVSSVSEDEEQLVPDVLDDPKYRLPLMQLMSRKKRKGLEKGGGSKKRRKRDRSYEEEGSGYDSGSYTEEWNKKEKTDFTRALFTVGVDALYDDDSKVTGFDWTRFRNIADFPKKSDEMLEEHYRRLMAEVHALLDGDEREKKAKTSRSKHGDSCECETCDSSRKSGKRKRNEDDERGSDGEAEGKGKDRLIGLVTAQKLRVRIGILEAAQRVDTTIWDFAMAKLDTQLQSSLKEFPNWWARGPHDRDLMRGCARHGVGQWNQIWNDPVLESFATEKEYFLSQGQEIPWPSNQAAMKRVRELGLAMMSEMKRLAKKDAEEEREKRKLAKKREKKLAKKEARSREESGTGRRKQDLENRSQLDASEEEFGMEMDIEQADHSQPVVQEDGESTADESESERQERIVEKADEIETEDENGAGENIEMREEYEFTQSGNDYDERHAWGDSEEDDEGFETATESEE